MTAAEGIKNSTLKPAEDVMPIEQLPEDTPVLLGNGVDSEYGYKIGDKLFEAISGNELTRFRATFFKNISDFEKSQLERWKKH